MDELWTTQSRAASAPPDMERQTSWVGDDKSPGSLASLRFAVTELLVALNEALRDERGKAAERLLRAEAFLAPAPPAARPTVNHHGLAPWQVRRVVTHLNSHLNTPIRNKDLAILVRLSEFHFNVAFRRSFGDSPHAYLVRLRMERAQGLMLSTEMSLSEIAVECGFADQPHFSRLFRRFAGESPAAWRRARANR